MRACKAHDYHVYLVGYLADCAGKLFGHVQKRYYDADAEGHAGNADVGEIRQHQRAARQGDHYIHHVADISQKGHQNVGKTVAVAGIVKDFPVYFTKSAFAPSS